MTCFWVGILHSLSLSEYQLAKSEYIPINNPLKLVTLLKTNNQLTNSIKINDRSLSDQELTENHNAINEYNISNICDGYFCSTSDPFLCLVSQIFEINITHKFNDCDIRYTNDKSKKIVYYQSNNDHFWFIRSSNITISSNDNIQANTNISDCKEIIKLPITRKKYR